MQREVVVRRCDRRSRSSRRAAAPSPSTVSGRSVRCAVTVERGVGVPSIVTRATMPLVTRRSRRRRSHRSACTCTAASRSSAPMAVDERAGAVERACRAAPAVVTRTISESTDVPTCGSRRPRPCRRTDGRPRRTRRPLPSSDRPSCRRSERPVERAVGDEPGDERARSDPTADDVAAVGSSSDAGRLARLARGDVDRLQATAPQRTVRVTGPRGRRARIDAERHDDGHGEQPRRTRLVHLEGDAGNRGSIAWDSPWRAGRP